MKEARNKLLMQEMTRKQFLQFLAGGVIALLGFSNLLSLLMHSGRQTQQLPDTNRHGFGSRKFGA